MTERKLFQAILSPKQCVTCDRNEMKVKKERCRIGRVCIAGGSFAYTYRAVENMNAQYRHEEERLFSNYARTWL